MYLVIQPKLEAYRQILRNVVALILSYSMSHASIIDFLIYAKTVYFPLPKAKRWWQIRRKSSNLYPVMFFSLMLETQYWLTQMRDRNQDSSDIRPLRRRNNRPKLSTMVLKNTYYLGGVHCTRFRPLFSSPKRDALWSSSACPIDQIPLNGSRWIFSGRLDTSKVRILITPRMKWIWPATTREISR